MWSKARRIAEVLILHFADVMDAHIPLVAGAAKGMGKPARLVVALKHQHAFAAVLRQQDRGREAADAGPDYDRIPLFIEICLLVWSSLGCHCVLAGHCSMLTVTTSI